jgi:glucose-1-phosphate thymidylyltransferase
LLKGIELLKVIIPVAGFAKRMRPHSHTKPKPLITVAGKTSVAFILDELEKMDVSEIIFITGHLKEKFEDYMRKNYKFKMRFIEQKVINGTAGAVLLAEQFVDEPVLVVFVDTVFETDFGVIKKLKVDEAGIIFVKTAEDYQRFGVCVLGKEGHIVRFVEKPSEPISKLASIGMHYIKDYKLMFEGIHHLFDSKVSMKGEYWLTDAIQYMIDHGAKIICSEVDGWYDTGKPETTLESNRILLKKHHTINVASKNSFIIQPVFVAPGVAIENSIIGPNVAIEQGSIIRDSIIRDSIICENSNINSMLIESSIIGDFVELKGRFKKLNVGDHSTLKEED